MNDSVLRHALKTSVLLPHFGQPDTVVLDELSLMHGASRVDLAVVNGSLHGFEIKSARDTLTRLPQQVLLYGAVLDQATLVVAQRHLDRAMDIIPDWWGIEVVDANSSNTPNFISLRSPEHNPSIEPFFVAQMLWRDEVIEFLEELGAAKGLYAKPRHKLYERLVEVATIDQIRERVRQRLKARISQKPVLLLPTNDD